MAMRPFNKLVNRAALRAETNAPEILHRTFVPVEQISNSLLRTDHQVLYGRRGTGKTHTFNHLAREVREDGDLPAYIDLRRIGSNNGLYGDTTLSLEQRATQLLIDILEAIHEVLLYTSIEDEVFEALFPHLDPLAEAIREVRVRGPVEQSVENEDETDEADGSNLALSLKSPKYVPEFHVGVSSSVGTRRRSKVVTQRSGMVLPHVVFGRLTNALEEAITAIRPRRVWILLDEWSNIPMDLQPLVADMLRRAVFPVTGYTVKIGAIERRSRFIERADAASYIGLELGADAAAAINLDEYLLASESGPRAQRFFAELLYKHMAVLAEDLNASFDGVDPSSLISIAFDSGAFAEFVRAAEGTPRDALNIAGLAGSAAGSSLIGISHVKQAARRYYLQDKENRIAGNVAAFDLWNRLQTEVVAERRSRTFLLRRNRDHTHGAILDLYDARLIHLLRPGLATPSRPGVGFDGYAVDYGSYIHLLGQEEADAIWNVRSRPWEFRGDEAVLPDRFDEGVIFTPAKPNAVRARRRNK